MMHTWFECKIRYEKVMENGMNKKVTEPYLVDALSFTEDPGAGNHRCFLGRGGRPGAGGL